MSFFATARTVDGLAAFAGVELSPGTLADRAKQLIEGIRRQQTFATNNPKPQTGNTTGEK